jgi:hypothetical protein
LRPCQSGAIFRQRLSERRPVAVAVLAPCRCLDLDPDPDPDSDFDFDFDGLNVGSLH